MGRIDFGEHGATSVPLNSLIYDANSSTSLKVAGPSTVAALEIELSRVDNKVTQIEKQLEARLKEFEAELMKTYKDKADKSEDRIDALDEKLDETRVKNVEVLAVFVGLFTFVSVDFQILRETPDWMAAVGLIWISVGMLLGFVLLTDFVLTGAYRRLSTLKELSGQFVLQLIKLLAIISISYFCIHKGMTLFEKHERHASTPEERGVDISEDRASLLIENKLELNTQFPDTGNTTSTR